MVEIHGGPKGCQGDRVIDLYDLGESEWYHFVLSIGLTDKFVIWYRGPLSAQDNNFLTISAFDLLDLSGIYFAFQMSCLMV